MNEQNATANADDAATRDEAKRKIEEQAWADYTAAQGKIVLVRAVNGYVGMNSAEFFLDPPARVRVGTTRESDVKRWNRCGEMWCDPYWEVTLAEPHPQLAGVSSMWIHATSYLLGSDRTEASDVVEILGDAPVSAYEVLESLWERYDFGNEAAIEDSSGWTNCGFDEWTRPVYLKPVDLGQVDFDPSTSEKVTFTVRLNPDLSVADVYVITKSGNKLGFLPADESVSGRVIAAGAAAIKAHKEALLIEGDEEIQVFQLLATLHERCASSGIDLDAVYKQVRDDIVAGEVASPLWKAQQAARRRAARS